MGKKRERNERLGEVKEGRVGELVLPVVVRLNVNIVTRQ